MRRLAFAVVVALIALIGWSARWHYETITREDGTSVLVRTNRLNDTVQVFSRSQWRTVEPPRPYLPPLSEQVPTAFASPELKYLPPNTLDEILGRKPAQSGR